MAPLTSRPSIRDAGAIKVLFLKAFAGFSADRIPRLAAAFSFYAVLAMSPLLVIAVVGGSIYYSHKLSAQRALLDQVELILGKEVGDLFREILRGAMKGSSTTVATMLSSVVAFFAASNLFLQLDDAIHSIWKIQTQGTFIRSLIRTRLSAFAGVLVFGAATLTWLIFDSWLFILKTENPQFAGWEIVLFLASVVFLFFFFMIVLRFLPKNRTHWSDVWPGALVIALGISILKLLLNQYFSNFRVSAAYGAAGSIVIILLWVYYTSQIYFFGVELTYVYTHQFGTLFGKEDIETQRS